jgi:hypothetical protein
MDFISKVVLEAPGRMVDDILEALQADSSFTNIPVEQPDSNNDIGQFTELSHLLRGSQRDKRPQSRSRQDTLQSCSDLSVYGVAHS